MAKSKETQKEDLNEIFMEISEELGNISDELAELNSSLSMIGTMITINMLSDKRSWVKVTENHRENKVLGIHFSFKYPLHHLLALFSSSRTRPTIS
jgi:hypothetical protein